MFGDRSDINFKLFYINRKKTDEFTHLIIYPLLKRGKKKKVEKLYKCLVYICQCLINDAVIKTLVK